MEKGTKITLWSIGGLVVATGLFLGIRAIVKSTRKPSVILPPSPPPPPPAPPPPPKPENGGGGGGPKIRGGSFPIRFGDRGDHVEAWQKAINKWDDDWCSWSACNGGTYRSAINVDGKFGEQTALYTNCHYPSTDCALCPLVGKGSLYPIGSADYSQCSVSWSKFKSVVGSSASKYKNFEGAGEDDYSNAVGQTPAQRDLESRGGCPCDEVHPECCMPDYVDVPTPTGAPYSNVNGVGFDRDIGINNIFYGTTFSGEQTDDEYLNMYKGFN